LWKKQETGIEFVKHYRAHMMPIVGVSASADGELFASTAEDESAKVFDVVNFGALDDGPLASVCFLTLHIHSQLRYDQYDQAWLRAKSLLLRPCAVSVTFLIVYSSVRTPTSPKNWERRLIGKDLFETPCHAPFRISPARPPIDHHHNLAVLVQTTRLTSN
jgi:hypothetical protein